MATTILDSPVDYDSDLTDPPTDIDDIQPLLNRNFKGMNLSSQVLGFRSTSTLKRESRSWSSSDEDHKDSFSDADNDLKRPAKRARLSQLDPFSKFETVPTEILNEIVSYLPDDQDLANLTRTCTSFKSGLVPLESAIWRERFLALYDYPDVRGPVDFGLAYQLRRFVLRNFVEFVNPRDKRLLIQLETIKDMIVETYFQPKKHLRPPMTSRNLAAFTSPHNSQWMVKFLSSPFFPSPRQAYGQPHALFDVLQLVVSHLLLSPASQMSHIVNSATVNYDMAIVYNWHRPLSTLYRRLPEEKKQESAEPRRSMPRKMFPNLRPPRKQSQPTTAARPTHELDTHALLHIRNFWHRHLTDDGSHGFKKGIGQIVANTYAQMARDLVRCGITPTKWERPLHEAPLNIATEWYGNYSCIHPWPRKRQDLETFQSCAEDWQEIDPLKLDFAISTNNGNDGDGFWAPIFSSIPVFAKTVPPDLKSPLCIFIRGLAPFVELPSAAEASSKRLRGPGSQSTLTVPKLPKYHPYLALRLRGVVHSIEAQPQQQQSKDGNSGIPGWNRIAMVLYQPSKRYLIQVLEHAEEEFGGHFGPALTNQFAGPGSGSGQGQGPPGQAQGTQQLDATEIDRQLEGYLHQKLLTNPRWRDGTKMSRDVIEDMEERFRLSEFLDWNDIDYAYAYEGVILPGGKIMMGRWWQVGMFGEGEGLELGEQLAEDVGDEDGDDGGENASPQSDDTLAAEDTSSSSSPSPPQANAPSTAPPPVNRRHRKLNRGPFVFWC